MKKFLRVLSFAAALVMVLTVLAACKRDSDTTTGNGTTGNSDSGSGTTVSTKGGETTTNKYDIIDDVGEQDFGGVEIRIGSCGRSWYLDEVAVERANGYVVNDAVYARNNVVETRLGIKIVNTLGDATGVAQYAISEELRTLYKSGDHKYDIILNPVYSTIMYTGEGIFADLTEIDYLDLSKPYWSKHFNSTASIGDAQYMATGAISLSFYRFLFATFVNLNLLEADPEAPDIYEVVSDMKWTIEYQYQLLKNYYSPTTGIDGDERNTYGFVASPYLSVDPYWSSFEISILTKTTDNYYEYNLNMERLTSGVDAILKLFYDRSSYMYQPDFAHESGNGEQEEIAKKFANGTAVMATIRLYEAEGKYLREMHDKYTVIPIPLLDESQEEYYSYQHDTFTGIGVPSSTPESKLSVVGACLEVMASESYRIVTPAYYETALKARYIDEPEAWEILDRMTANVKIDAGVLYTKALADVHQKLRSIVRNDKSNTASSVYGGITTTVEGKLVELQDAIKALKN